MLRPVIARNPLLKVYGVDPDPQKIARAQLLFPHQQANLVSRDIFDPDTLQLISEVDVVVVMIGRLLEGAQDSALAIVERVKRFQVSLICYAYADWLHRYDFLTAAARLGVSFSDSSVSITRYVAVAIAENKLPHCQP